MSVRVMTWVWQHSQAKSTARLVLLAIADCANDVGADAYPSTASLARKTALSERGVRCAVTVLESLGELRVEYKAGPKGCNRYRILMRDPEQRAGSTRQDVPGTRKDMPGTDPEPDARYPEQRARSDPKDPAPRARNPARRAPEPSLNPTDTSRSVVGHSLAADAATTTKGTRIPDDFTATPDMIEWAKKNTPLVGLKETAAFVDYWRGRAGANGRKVDWPATWRNWMRREQTNAEDRLARPHGRASPGLVDVNGHKLRPETAARMADRTRFEAMDQDRLAIEGPAP